MRPTILNPLFAAAESVKGVGPALAKPLQRLRLERVRDFLYHLPTDFVHRTRIANLDEAQPGDQVIVELEPVEYQASHGRGPFRVQAIDAIGNYVSLVYFGRNTGWARKQHPLNEKKCVAGKLEMYGQTLQIVHPDYVVDASEADQIAGREPVYPLAEGMTQKRLAGLIETALAQVPSLPEWIEPSVLDKHGWPAWQDALQLAHAAENERARDRLAYDEIFANQLALMLVRAANRSRKGAPLRGDGRLRDALPLPFALTGAQTKAVQEIQGDLEQSMPMLRLLQGDVGSGKTIVAVLALLSAAECGKQGALLAPTEILARQHYETISRMLHGLPVEVAILTGRDKGRAREATLMGIADGSIDIVIGTHAIFQEAVTYRDLALTIIDEQHRFGVSQRLLLSKKGKVTPHFLAMTATPIPRTLTLSQYGEMDVSRLDELPPGRQPIETRVTSGERLDEVIAGLGRHIEADGQAYWVCPLVSESETSDLAAAEERAAQLKARFGDKVGLVHGQMKADLKDAVMDDFMRGKIAVLVSTTVIEVGVDVPNSTLMIIEAAERFGLAQLHQLRGRVGRGTGKSICLLLRGGGLSETARERLALMRSSQDGFFLAEEDLRLRGGGEVLGTRQSGDNAFRIASAEQVIALAPTANDDARLLIERDGGLDSERGQAARTALYLFERDVGAMLLRSG